MKQGDRNNGTYMQLTILPFCPAISATPRGIAMFRIQSQDMRTQILQTARINKHGHTSEACITCHGFNKCSNLMSGWIECYVVGLLAAVRYPFSSIEEVVSSSPPDKFRRRVDNLDSLHKCIEARATKSFGQFRIDSMGNWSNCRLERESWIPYRSWESCSKIFSRLTYATFGSGTHS